MRPWTAHLNPSSENVKKYISSFGSHFLQSERNYFAQFYRGNICVKLFLISTYGLIWFRRCHFVRIGKISRRNYKEAAVIPCSLDYVVGKQCVKLRKIYTQLILFLQLT